MDNESPSEGATDTQEPPDNITILDVYKVIIENCIDISRIAIMVSCVEGR